MAHLMFHTRDTVELSYDRVTRSSSTLCGVPSAPTVSAATTNGQKMHHLALLVQCPTRLATRQPWQYCAWIVTPLPPPQNFAVAIVTQSISKAKESTRRRPHSLAGDAMDDAKIRISALSRHPQQASKTQHDTEKPHSLAGVAMDDAKIRISANCCVFSTSAARKEDA